MKEIIWQIMLYGNNMANNMATPENISPYLIPEFEESDCGVVVNAGAINMENQPSSDITQQLKLLQGELKQWGSSTYDKKKLARCDYEEFTGLCNKLAILIERAETKYNTLSGISGEITKNFQRLEERITQLNTTVTEGQNGKFSYAEIVQIPGRMSSNSEQSRDLRIKKNPAKQKVVIVKPKQLNGSEREASNKLKETLKQSISKEHNLKVQKTVSIRGGGVLLVLDPAEDKNKILESEVFSDPNYEVSEPSIKKPRIILYDVPVELSKQDLVTNIYNRNFFKTMTYENFCNQFNPAFKVGPRGKEYVHWVVECSPDLRKAIINSLRIYIGWTSCRAKDYVAVSRCFKCQGLGHIGKYCNKDVNVCAHCATSGHDVKNCPNRTSDPSCINCKKQKKSPNHAASDKNCPSYLKAMQQIIDKTDYGF